ncbi:hypothetical protein MLD52_19280 [Puniceicoccaceae bacterium K14]|nr:hypothetical protein [Puniceicoccaceae bacterium K14]
MKILAYYFIAFSTFAAFNAQVGAMEETRLFAALAMTKAQESSPIPTDSGVFIYNGNTDTWERTGPVIQSVGSITTDPSNPDVVFLACGNGIVRSRDGGQTWRMTSGWRESDFTKIAIDPVDGNNVYATSVWGMSVSRDGGDTWARANRGLAERYSRTVIVDSRNPKRLLLGTADGIYQSNNRAKSWQVVRSSPRLTILRIARSESNPDLWIAGTEGEGVFLSKDDGKSWSKTAPELGNANIYAVAMDSSDESRLAVAGWGTGVWISIDGGASWIDRGAGLPSKNVTAMIYDPNQSNRLWVSTFEEGTLYSDNEGKDWHDGGLKGAYVFDLGVVSIK